MPKFDHVASRRRHESYWSVRKLKKPAPPTNTELYRYTDQVHGEVNSYAPDNVQAYSLTGKFFVDPKPKKKRLIAAMAELDSKIYDHFSSDAYTKHLLFISDMLDYEPHFEQLDTHRKDYRDYALIGRIVNKEIRSKLLQSLLDKMKPENPEKLDREYSKRFEAEKEINRDSLIRIGLTTHTPAPLEEYTPAFRAEDHLTFLKDSLDDLGWNANLEAHFEQVKQKTSDKKEHASKSRLLAEISLLEKDPKKKRGYFHEAIAEASQIKTGQLRDNVLKELYSIALFTNDMHQTGAFVGRQSQVVQLNTENVYKEFVTDPAFANIPQRKKRAAKATVPANASFESFDDVTRVAQKKDSALYRSRVYAQAYVLESKDGGAKMAYYDLAFKYGRLVKSSKAKAANAIALRDNAPDEMAAKRAQDLFLDNGKVPYKILLEDGQNMSSSLQRRYYTNKSTVLAIEDRRFETAANQRNYAQARKDFSGSYFNYTT